MMKTIFEFFLILVCFFSSVYYALNLSKLISDDCCPSSENRYAILKLERDTLVSIMKFLELRIYPIPCCKCYLGSHYLGNIFPNGKMMTKVPSYGNNIRLHISTSLFFEELKLVTTKYQVLLCDTHNHTSSDLRFTFLLVDLCFPTFHTIILFSNFVPVFLSSS